MVVSPNLGVRQIDSLCQRLEHHWRDPGQGALDITCQQMGAVLFALFPEEFEGDRYEAMAMAAAIRAVNNGVRPMPNGYRAEGEEYQVRNCTAVRRAGAAVVFDVAVEMERA